MGMAISSCLRSCSHGSSSQYSTSLGAASLSSFSKMSLGSVLTFSFCRITGTGTTIAKFAAGPS
jgi:hypothetical protein